MGTETPDTAAAAAVVEGILAPPAGRRSERIHVEILTATQDLLREGGYPAATVEAVAARAGVSKPTIYNHWPSRTALAAHAFGILMADRIPPPDTGTTAGDLTEMVRHVSALYAGDLGEVFAQLMAACVNDPSGATYFRVYFLARRRLAIAQMWQRGVERGDARPDVAVDDVIDLLFGPLIFRRLTGHHDLSDASAERLARTVLPAILLTAAPPEAG